MNTPVIWVGLPLVIGIVLLIAAPSNRWTIALGVAAALFFAVLAFWLPVDTPVEIRGFAFRVASDLTFLGRRLVIPPDAVGVIGMAYASAILWFFGALTASPGRLFVPFSLIVIALAVAGISVEPWTFQGIFLFLAILLCVPLLSPPGVPLRQAVLRFLTFQMIGIPFLLMASSLMTGLESAPPGLPIVARPAVFLGLGFAFLLALFPFHAWIPRLFEQVHPYAASFVLVILPGFFTIAVFELIDRYIWLRGSAEVFSLIRSVGILTVVAGAFWTAFQRNLGRILGFAALVDTGMFLLAIGAGGGVGPRLFFPLLAARTLGFVVSGLGLSLILKDRDSLWFRDVQGAAHDHPLAGVAVLAGIFTVAGLPLLPGFVPRLNLILALAPFAPSAAIATWIGMLGILIAAFRVLSALFSLPRQEAAPVEAAGLPGVDLRATALAHNLVLVGGTLLLLLAGIMPGWVIWLVEQLPPAFEQLRP